MKFLTRLLPLMWCAIVLQPSLGQTAEHGLSPIYNWTHVVSEEDQSYHFHSPGFSYSILTGRNIGFLGRATVIFPRGLYQDGEKYSYDEIYDTGIGADILMGAGYQHMFTSNLAWINGLGFHTNAMQLTSADYESFYNFTAGVGVESRLMYRVHKWTRLGGFVNAAVDFGDFIHTENRLKAGVFITAGLTVEFNFEPEVEK